MIWCRKKTFKAIVQEVIEDALQKCLELLEPMAEGLIRASTAQTYYAKLEREIQHYSGQGVPLAVEVNLGEANPLHVTGVGFCNPTMIILRGVNAKKENCIVLAHMNSLQLVLRVMESEQEEAIRTPEFVGEISGVH